MITDKQICEILDNHTNVVDIVKIAYQAGVEAEREACAKWYTETGCHLDEGDVAEAIRARSNP